MKRYLVTPVLLLVLGLLLFPTEGKTQMGPGMMGPGMMGPQGGYRGWYCPYCGRYMGPGGGYGMGPGMMGPGMMGPGMMGPGYPGYGPQYGPQYGPPYQPPQKPMEEKDARAVLEDYLRSTRNPNLKLGKVTEKDNYFEAEILTKDNSLADKIIVDKYSGWMRSIY